MKSNKLIASALLALGLVSSASASSTFGTTNIVYITGSTAFRPNLFAALVNTSASSTVFDASSTVHTFVAGGGAANNGSSTYNAVGVIGGNAYIISVALTGSEAGIGSLVGNPITYKVPANAEMAGGPTTNNTPVALAGLPKPTFLEPDNSVADVTSQTPDFAFADTSIAVSLSSTFSGNLTEYGIVGVIPFIWAKGVDSTSPRSSWTDLSNVSEYQLEDYFAGNKKANILTGVATDTDPVYLIGRNEGSGTRVNTLCNEFKSIVTAITQYAPNNSSYASSGNVLTVGSVTPFTVAAIGANSTGIHLASVGNDGFDAGSGVKSTLNYDISGLAFVTIGYLGTSDAGGLTKAFLASTNSLGQELTLDGVAESDNAVINGQYDFWGHEHLYGQQTPTSPAALVVGNMMGSLIGTPNTQLPGFTSSGALEAAGNLSAGGGIGGQSTCIDPALMHADRPLGGDTGYPLPF